MAEYTGTFETGVDGNTISAADAGSTTAWDDVFEGVDGTCKYSNIQKYGTLSAQFVMSATPTSPYVEWDPTTISPGLTEVWDRVYMHHSGLPNTTCTVINAFNGGAGGWSMRIDSSGFIAMHDAAGVPRAQGAVAISTGQWVRAECHVVHSATVGSLEFKLFNDADSSTPTETQSSAASFNTETQTTRLRFGSMGPGNASRTLYLDNIVANDTGYPGPFIVPTGANLAPVIYGRGAA